MENFEEVPETIIKIIENAKKNTIYGSPKGGKPTNKSIRPEEPTTWFKTVFKQEQLGDVKPEEKPEEKPETMSDFCKGLKFNPNSITQDDKNRKLYREKAARYAGKPNMRNDEGGYCL